MLSIKEGLLYWALNKDATLVQRAYGVLLPQLLLLYNNKEESRSNTIKPKKYFNLQHCLAIHPTDQCPNFFGIILMVVPGGVGLIGCISEDERRKWMEDLNEAMDTEVVSSELLEFIETVQGRQDGLIKLPNVTLHDSDNDNSQYDQMPNSFFPDFKSNSPALPNSPQAISPITINQRPTNAMVSSCAPMSLLESPLPESPIEISRFEEVESCQSDCLTEVPNTLHSTYPSIVANANNDNIGKEFQEPIVQETLTNGILDERHRVPEKLANGEERIIDNIKSLNKMLISQEAAKAILEESCDKIRGTLSVLYDRLRIKGIQIGPALYQPPSDPVSKQPNESLPVQDIPGSLDGFRNVDNSYKIQSNGHSPEQLGVPNEMDTDSFNSTGNSGYSGSRASSVQTLVAPEVENQDAWPHDLHQSLCCSPCLKALASGILEISMNLVTSQTLPTPQTISRVRSLISYLHSHLLDLIKSIRNRTNLPSDILVTALAKLALTDQDSPMIVQALIENASGEVCGQILKEISLHDDKIEKNSINLINGFDKDQFNSLPEKTDIEWMLPGYIASCLMLYRLTESRGSKVEEFDGSLEKPIKNGNSQNSQIEDIIESLSVTLIQAVCQANNGNFTDNDIPIQLSQEFEFIFFELLMGKFDGVTMEKIMPGIADYRTMNPDKFFISRFHSPNQTTTLEELRSSFVNGNENDNSFMRKQNSPDELGGLSTHLLKNRQSSYGRVPMKRETRSVEGTDQREHENEKTQLLRDVQQNWFNRHYYDAYTTESELQLKSLHSQLNRLCADTVNSAEHSGAPSDSPAIKLATAQEVIRDSHRALLDQLENAIHIFSKFIHSSVYLQESMRKKEDEGNDFTEIASRVPEALAKLAAAVNDLHARLSCDIESQYFVSGR
nr:hypothetical transcript [Hymenolepis microstoma]